MLFAQVVGTVVSSVRSDTVDGARFLLVQECGHRGEGSGGYIVALDCVSAGPGEMVLVSQGSSARQTRETYQKPIDAVIIGIVDRVTEMENVVYRK